MPVLPWMRTNSSWHRNRLLPLRLQLPFSCPQCHVHLSVAGGEVEPAVDGLPLRKHSRSVADRDAVIEPAAFARRGVLFFGAVAAVGVQPELLAGRVGGGALVEDHQVRLADERITEVDVILRTVA